MGVVEREKHTVELMIRLYCRKKEGNKTPCDECIALIEYAHLRLLKCRYGDSKKSCSHCLNHCYKPEMRSRIREVMRFSGVRMLLYSPLEVLRHLFFK